MTATAWDCENRLRTIQVPGGSVVTNTYGTDGLRQKREEGAATVKYVWDGQRLLLESDAADATQALYTAGLGVYGPMQSMRRGTVQRYLHPDAQGSIWTITDTSGGSSDSYTYDVFGVQLSTWGAGSVNPFRYIGQEGYYTEPDLGLNYVRARWLRPSTGSWLSADPVPSEPRYQYVGGRPTMASDAAGLSLLSAHLTMATTQAQLLALLASDYACLYCLMPEQWEARLLELESVVDVVGPQPYRAPGPGEGTAAWLRYVRGYTAAQLQAGRAWAEVRAAAKRQALVDAEALDPWEVWVPGQVFVLPAGGPIGLPMFHAPLPGLHNQVVRPPQRRPLTPEELWRRRERSRCRRRAFDAYADGQRVHDECVDGVEEVWTGCMEACRGTFVPGLPGPNPQAWLASAAVTMLDAQANLATYIHTKHPPRYLYPKQPSPPPGSVTPVRVMWGEWILGAVAQVVAALSLCAEGCYAASAYGRISCRRAFERDMAATDGSLEECLRRVSARVYRE